MAGTASAGTNQVGTIGSASQPVDIESEDISNADTVTTQDLVVNGTATGPFGGGGIIFEEGDSVQEFKGNNITVNSTSYQTIFDLNNAVDVYGGAVYGIKAVQFRVTFGSGTTVTIGNQNVSFGRNDSKDAFTVLSVFPMANVSKLEFFNRDSASEEFGFQVYTT